VAVPANAVSGSPLEQEKSGAARNAISVALPTDSTFIGSPRSEFLDDRLCGRRICGRSYYTTDDETLRMNANDFRIPGIGLSGSISYSRFT
jgi:hypothetical protein